MNDGIRLLREYLSELRCDERMVALLRTAGLGPVQQERALLDAESLAGSWIDEGAPIGLGTRSQVVRFVAHRMPGLLVRFRGNSGAAEQTMMNLLDARFNHLRSAGTTDS